MRRLASVFSTGVVLCALGLAGPGTQAVAQPSVDARWTFEPDRSPEVRPHPSFSPDNGSAFSPQIGPGAAIPFGLIPSTPVHPAGARRGFLSSAFFHPLDNAASGHPAGRSVERIREHDLNALAATDQLEVWRETDRFADRLRLTTRGDLRRADGAPLPPTARDAHALDIDSYDFSFTRGWQAARGLTPSGIEVALIPHAGIAVGDAGGSAQAGATLRIGPDSLAPSGSERFGDRARWYIYAAGSGRAVGYNFARTRDGSFARSGMSHDAGAFLGDASLGVAYRRGDLQGSFGVVYRELRAEGLRGGEGFDRDVSEGLVAFQLSISPRR